MVIVFKNLWTCWVFKHKYPGSNPQVLALFVSKGNDYVPACLEWASEICQFLKAHAVLYAGVCFRYVIDDFTLGPIAVMSNNKQD